MMRSILTGAVAAVLLAAGPASAQDAVVEGPGYRIGEGTVLHPTVSFETGFISNVFYEEASPAAAAIVRLIGAFSIASQGNKPPGEIESGIEDEGLEPDPADEPTPPQLDFRIGGNLALAGYLSGNDRVRDQSDVAAALNAHVVVFPEGDVSFGLDESFIRDTRPPNFESSGNLNRDYNHLQLRVVYRPGGRAMAFGARYENTIDRFESSGSSFASRLQHTLGVSADWQWLPITKFFFDTSLGFFGPLDDSAGFKSSSMPLRIRLGIGTALTELTTLRAHVGYGNGFYSTGQNFNMALYGAEFGYRYAEYGRVRLTFNYDFYDSLQANFYRDYALLARVDHQFGLLVLGADGGVRLRGYRGIPAAIGAPSRDDVVLAATLRAHYLYRDWLALTGRLEATADQTDYMYMAPPAGTDDPSYQRFDLSMGVTAAF